MAITLVSHSPAARVPLFLFLPHFDLMCDLLLNRHTAKYFVKQIIMFETYGNISYIMYLQPKPFARSSSFIYIAYTLWNDMLP